MRELQPVDVGVMDLSNLQLAAGSRRSATQRCLAPYSPDFNPIKKAVSRLETMLCEAVERTVNGLWRLINKLINKLINIFQPKDYVNYFSWCGYDLD